MPMPVKYRRPKWRNGNYPFIHWLSQGRLSFQSEDVLKKLAAITDEELTELRDEAIETGGHNAALYDFAKAEHAALITEVERLYGKGAKQAKYLLRQENRPDSEHLIQDWSEQDLDSYLGKHVPEAHRILALREKEEDRDRRRQALLQDAIALLVSRGNVIGQHFTLEDAIDKADLLAFHEEVDRQMPKEGDFVSFDGSDGCQTCRGWDGGDNRCDCGNRRVSWVMGCSHSFKEPIVYAEAH